jgi:hypothetical protein
MGVSYSAGEDGRCTSIVKAIELPIVAIRSTNFRSHGIPRTRPGGNAELVNKGLPLDCRDGLGAGRFGNHPEMLGVSVGIEPREDLQDAFATGLHQT